MCDLPVKYRLPTEAAVFEFGVLAQSPRAKTLPYAFDWSVCAFTSTHPFPSVSPFCFSAQSRRALIGLHGGAICRREYLTKLWFNERNKLLPESLSSLLLVETSRSKERRLPLGLLRQFLPAHIWCSIQSHVLQSHSLATLHIFQLQILSPARCCR